MNNNTNTTNSSLDVIRRAVLAMRMHSKHSRRNFGPKSMRRGLQVSAEKKQRPARLAFIAESQRQANEIAEQLRTAYLERRAGLI